MKRLSVVLIASAALASCGSPAPETLQGYGEADYIYLSAQDPGIVREVLVKEGDVVEAGAPIFRLDGDRLGYTAASAEAQRTALAQSVRAAQADADLARRTLSRGEELFGRGFYPRARLDSDRAAYNAAAARVEEARRQLGAAGAETDLARQRVDDLAGVAPVAGVIERIYHRPGEMVAAGAPIVALLPPENMKVRFFAPEEMLSQLREGGAVMVSCDGCADNLTGRISFIAREPQFTPPVIYSLDQREKLVFLVEARLDDARAVRPGAPVDVRIVAE